ncbi:MAG: hypothetical protein ABSA11_10810 [Candidatus Bathyarchaeia archaeon]
MEAEIRWAPIWTDEKIIKTVLTQTDGIFKKLKKGSSLKLAFPYFEYGYQPIENQELDFQREVDLAEHLELKSNLEILEEIGRLVSFKPFITQLEVDLIALLDLPEFFRFILDYLLDIPEIPIKQKDEIKALTSLPREILQDKIIKSGNREKPFPFALADKYVLPILPIYPDLPLIIQNLAVNEKKIITNYFKGEKYFVYFQQIDEKPFQELPVYFPITAKDSLPNTGEFKGRVISIVSYNTNFPLGQKKGNPFFLRAVSLFLSYEFKKK